MTQHQTIETEILSLISSSEKKITPANLEKAISGSRCIKKTEVRLALKNLIQKEELIYTYEFGHTFIETSFNKPTRISNQVVLTPPERHYQALSNDVVVNIAGGASFGTGRHPTTRIAVRGIESAITDYRISNNSRLASCLDLGTGSGILVITAVLLGVESGIGIDIDPNAVSEARENVRLNGLTERVRIKNQSIDEIDGTFPLILANLRYTALLKLYPALSTMCGQEGYIVMSGIKSEEIPEIFAVYRKNKFQVLFLEEEMGWAGLVLKTRDSPL